MFGQEPTVGSVVDSGLVNMRDGSGEVLKITMNIGDYHLRDVYCDKFQGPTPQFGDMLSVDNGGGHWIRWTPKGAAGAIPLRKRGYIENPDDPALMRN